MNSTDISITGNCGFYRIAFYTLPAIKWAEANVDPDCVSDSAALPGAGGFAVYSDQTRMVQDIADAANAEGFSVEVR